MEVAAQITWEKEPTFVDGVTCFLGTGPDGWYCASQSGPRFCFIDGTRDGVIKIAERAMKMYGNYERKQDD